MHTYDSKHRSTTSPNKCTHLALQPPLPSSPPIKENIGLQTYAKSFSQISVFPVTEPRIQPKLTVGAPGDRYEQEADRVADQVMRMPEPYLQRKYEHNNMRSIQTNGITMPTPAAQPAIQSLSQSRGQALPLSTRSFMESRFGHDFSHVRMHTGHDASIMSKKLNARAFTYGSDIYFRQGEYQPETNSGKKLLAHELTHTMQNSQKVQRANDLSKTRPQDLPYRPYHSEMEAGYRALQELKAKLPKEPTEGVKEWGTTIFRVNTDDGYLYSFMPLTEGTGYEWHPTGLIPSYAEETAIAHTHPNGSYFSTTDADLALGKSGFIKKKRTVFMVNHKGAYWFYGRDPGGVDMERSARKGKF